MLALLAFSCLLQQAFPKIDPLCKAMCVRIVGAFEPAGPQRKAANSTAVVVEGSKPVASGPADGATRMMNCRQSHFIHSHSRHNTKHYHSF